jgi:DNA polymerase I-like protein with 3'-5' exonuclease and polymerase domains
MTASRLLGLGKEKFKVPQEIDPDSENDEGPDNEESVNPIDHRLPAVVFRYLGIKMDKAKTKLGESDWGRADLSEAYYRYMKEDVLHLPALWGALQAELRGAQLEGVFLERMQFAVHLNVIKMAGNPVDRVQIASDREEVVAREEKVYEELREMFTDYSHPIPKSRLKTVLTMEKGKIKRTPGPTHEQFSPSNRNHWIAALALHGIHVENTQTTSLRKTDAPEARVLLRYAGAKKRIEEIDGITRALFPDGRVRASGWNQLAARTGRITSTEPNLQ